MARLPLPPAETITLRSLAELAHGGMGTIELVRVEGGKRDGQLLAVKRLHDRFAKDPQFVAMFLDEAWMTAALKAPNVVQVVTWGTDNKGMFLASELVQGVSLHGLLRAVLQRKESIAERTVAFLCSEICAGLAAAHELRGTDGSPLGLVHRDLTVSNVLVSFKGEVKVADFGIAKARARITQTETGMLKGKPGCMAPEQARGQELDHRADIFSFGVLMFELLAGRRPWIADEPIVLMLEAAQEPPPDLTKLRSGCDPRLVAIVNQCLEKEPSKRFSSALAIKDELDEWRAEKGFVGGERDTLAKFVLRMCEPQVEWFKRALAGDFAKGNATTFKDVEENGASEISGRSVPRRSGMIIASEPMNEGNPRESSSPPPPPPSGPTPSGPTPSGPTPSGPTPSAAQAKNEGPARFSFVARWAVQAKEEAAAAPGAAPGAMPGAGLGAALGAAAPGAPAPRPSSPGASAPGAATSIPKPIIPSKPEPSAPVKGSAPTAAAKSDSTPQHKNPLPAASPKQEPAATVVHKNPLPAAATPKEPPAPTGGHKNPLPVAATSKEPPEPAAAQKNPPPAKTRAHQETLKSNEVIPDLLRAISGAQATAQRPPKKPPPTVKVTAATIESAIKGASSDSKNASSDSKSIIPPGPDTPRDPSVRAPQPLPPIEPAPATPRDLSPQPPPVTRDQRAASQTLSLPLNDETTAAAADDADDTESDSESIPTPPPQPPPPVPPSEPAPPRPVEVAKPVVVAAQIVAANIGKAAPIAINKKPAADDDIDAGPQPTMKSPLVSPSARPAPELPVDVRVSAPSPLPPPPPAPKSEPKAPKRRTEPGRTRISAVPARHAPAAIAPPPRKANEARSAILIALLALVAGAVLAWILRGHM